VKCQNCGKSNSVTINNKRYCADCGESVKHPHKSVAAKAPATHKAHKPHKKAKKGHVLDLSHAPVAPRPAQSVHGPAHHGTERVEHRQTEKSPEYSAKHERRLERALQVPKSPHIKKFGHIEQQARPAEAEPAYQPMAPSRVYSLREQQRAHQQAAHHRIEQHHVRHAMHQASEAAAAEAKPTRLQRLLGVMRRPRFATVTAIALVVLLMAGYISYLNYPNLAVKVAASRAGIDAQMPRYTPAGYSFDGPIDYTTGQLTIRFSSNSDNANLAVTQRRTAWDSQTLLESYVLPKNPKYLTFQQNGLTVYMYNGNNAAWVNKGLLYTIEGQNQLSTEQVLRMASSL
jgi:hypothetical protein